MFHFNRRILTAQGWGPSPLRTRRPCARRRSWSRTYKPPGPPLRGGSPPAPPWTVPSSSTSWRRTLVRSPTLGIAAQPHTSLWNRQSVLYTCLLTGNGTIVDGFWDLTIYKIDNNICFKYEISPTGYVLDLIGENLSYIYWCYYQLPRTTNDKLLRIISFMACCIQ